MAGMNGITGNVDIVVRLGGDSATLASVEFTVPVSIRFEGDSSGPQITFEESDVKDALLGPLRSIVEKLEDEIVA